MCKSHRQELPVENFLWIKCQWHENCLLTPSADEGRFTSLLSSGTVRSLRSRKLHESAWTLPSSIVTLSIDFSEEKTFSFFRCLLIEENFPSSSEKIRIRDDQIVNRQNIAKGLKVFNFPAANCEKCFIVTWITDAYGHDDALTVECVW